MRYIAIVIVFLFLQTNLYSQTPSPGGVKSPEFWITTYWDKADNKVQWGDEKNNRLDKITGDTLNINFHPSKKFNGNDTLKLHNTNIEQKTFVGAFYPEYNVTTIRSDIFFKTNFNELPVFTFKSNTVSVDSTSITDKLQLNFNTTFNVSSQSELISTMKIASYSYSRIPKSSPNPWGEVKETKINFPFIGYIPELLIYDRVLRNDELIRVHSYLAIKYGLTLPIDSNYYNSQGEVIWNGNNNKIYHHRVTAIGKDTLGAIEQPKSTTTYEDLINDSCSYYFNANETNRSLTIEFKDASYNSLPDRTFLFCGDDNVTIEKRQANTLYTTRFDSLWISQRRWIIQNYNPDSLLTIITIGNPLKSELDKGRQKPTYYLVEVDDDCIELQDLHPFNLDTTSVEVRKKDNILPIMKWRGNSSQLISFAVSEKLRFKAKKANRTMGRTLKRCSEKGEFEEIFESIAPKDLKYKNGFYYHRGNKWFKRCIYKINYGYANNILTFFCEGGIGNTLNYRIRDNQNNEVSNGVITRSNPNTGEFTILVNNLKGDYFLFITDETGQTSKLPILIK